jgi:1-phosphatidylinositol phosphodiesterase
LNYFMRLQGEHRSSHRWGISFASATAKLAGTPAAFADKVNAWLVDDLRKRESRRYGIVFIDFVGSENGQKLVGYLIRSNNSIRWL